MNYKQLKHIINVIKKTIRCPECGKAFNSKEIDLIDIYDDEGIIDAVCIHCDTEMSISIEIEEIRKNIPSTLVEQLKRTSKISDREVEDISKRLQGHKGGMEELFKSTAS